SPHASRFCHHRSILASDDCHRSLCRPWVSVWISDMSAFAGTRPAAMLAFDPPDLAIEMRLLRQRHGQTSTLPVPGGKRPLCIGLAVTTPAGGRDEIPRRRVDQRVVAGRDGIFSFPRADADRVERRIPA